MTNSPQIKAIISGESKKSPKVLPKHSSPTGENNNATSAKNLRYYQPPHPNKSVDDPDNPEVKKNSLIFIDF